MRGDGNIHPAELTKVALREEDRRYYDVFRSLSASRIWSQVGPNPIQISEIAAYLGMVGIEDHATKMKYTRILQGLDIVELKSIRAKTNK